jgi:hypothetical protein
MLSSKISQTAATVESVAGGEIIKSYFEKSFQNIQEMYNFKKIQNLSNKRVIH